MSSGIVLGVALLAAAKLVNSHPFFGKRDTDEASRQFHTVYDNPPVATLEVKAAFNSLTPKEKLYLHHFSRASWLGSKIVFHQVSEESPILFELFQTIFRPIFGRSDSGTVGALDSNTLLATYREAVERASIFKADFDHFIEYVAFFFANQGNYLSFGDSKFIPRVSKEIFRRICLSAPAPAAAEREKHAKKITALVDSVLEKTYSLEHKMLGFAENHAETTYYSPNVTEADARMVNDFMVEKHVSPYNTRLFKDSTGTLILRIAAAEDKIGELFSYKAAKIQLMYGDYQGQLKYVVRELQKAKEYAANDNQRQMLSAYITHFQTGSMEAFSESQRSWVKDKGPSVETNIGFIESYRDPFGVRGEFEGLVAVVNKPQSEKFGALVDKAPQLLAKMPWPKVYEKDEFSRPDFTSLEVVTFANSGIPAGINIPNLDDIRQEVGFKNVQLANVLLSAYSDSKYTFISDDDQKLYSALRVTAFEVQVGLHELLGHGSGKVFNEKPDGSVNFDKSIINPITGKTIDSWYSAGATWDSKFSSISSAYEECRAEAVGLFLCVDSDVLKIFGHASSSQQEDIIYINWLNMVRSGVMALELYAAPPAAKWNQAHSRARFSILQTLLRAGQGLVSIDVNAAGDDFVLRVDRSKIHSVGVPAIADYLLKLQVYKSTGDFPRGSTLFEELSAVDMAKWGKLREIVVAKKQPRKVFVQGHTIRKGDNVEIKEFEPTHAALIRSNILHFSEDV